jgi:short-subunit dehydrogenase
MICIIKNINSFTHNVLQVEVLVHAAELRPPATALSEQPLYAIRDALQVNAHFPVLLTKLLLPDLLQRAAGPNKLPHESVSGNLRKDADDRSASSKRSSASRADAAQEGVGSGHGGCRVLFVSSVNPTAPSSMTSIFSASKALVASFAQVKITLLRESMLCARVLRLVFMLDH